MQGVPFNVTLSTACLLHRKPLFTAAPHESCPVHVPYKMGILYFSTVELHLKTKYFNEVDIKCVNFKFPYRNFVYNKILEPKIHV